MRWTAAREQLLREVAKSKHSLVGMVDAEALGSWRQHLQSLVEALDVESLPALPAASSVEASCIPPPALQRATQTPLQRVCELVDAGPCCLSRCAQRVSTFGGGCVLQRLSTLWVAMDKQAKKAAFNAILLNQKAVCKFVSKSIESASDGAERSLPHLRIKYRVSPFGVVCRKTFLAIFGVSVHVVKKRLEAIREQQGLPLVSPHGLVGRASNNVRSECSQRLALEFVRQIAGCYGMVDDTASTSNSGTRKLPACVSKKVLHEAYCQWLQRVAERHAEAIAKLARDAAEPLGFQAFSGVMKRFAPHVRIQTRKRRASIAPQILVHSVLDNSVCPDESQLVQIADTACDCDVQRSKRVSVEVESDIDDEGRFRAFVDESALARHYDELEDSSFSTGQTVRDTDIVVQNARYALRDAVRSPAESLSSPSADN